MDTWTDPRMITKTSDTKTKLAKTNSRTKSETNAWTTAKVMGGVTWCQNHFEEKNLTNYNIKVIGQAATEMKENSAFLQMLVLRSQQGMIQLKLVNQFAFHTNC